MYNGDGENEIRNLHGSAFHTTPDGMHLPLIALTALAVERTQRCAARLGIDPELDLLEHEVPLFCPFPCNMSASSSKCV